MGLDLRVGGGIEHLTVLISTGVDIHTKETSFTEDMPSEYRNPRVIHQHNQDQQISIKCRKTA